MVLNFSSLSSVTPDDSTWLWDNNPPSYAQYLIYNTSAPLLLLKRFFIQNLNPFAVQIAFTGTADSFFDRNPRAAWGTSPDRISLNPTGSATGSDVDSIIFSDTILVPANQYLYFQATSAEDGLSVTLSSITGSDVPCLCKGMLLHTPTGPRPVEDLQPDDLVVTPDCRHVPVIRVFHTRVPSSDMTRPYRIPRGFCGETYPVWDILLSPHHAFFDFRDEEWKEPCETPGLHQESEEDTPPVIDYYHVQLPNHKTDKLVCFNLGVDSYLENHPL